MSIAAFLVDFCVLFPSGFLCFVSEQVAGVSAGQYVRLFEWDYSKFAVRQRLPALVALIQGGVGKIEEEHRNLSMVFAEKNQAMQVQYGTALYNGSLVLCGIRVVFDLCFLFVFLCFFLFFSR